MKEPVNFCHAKEILKEFTISLVGYEQKSLNSDLWRFIDLYMDIEKHFSALLINKKEDCQFKSKGSVKSVFRAPYLNLKKSNYLPAPLKTTLPTLSGQQLENYISLFKKTSNLISCDKEFRSNYSMNGLNIHPIVALLSQKKWLANVGVIRKNNRALSKIAASLNFASQEYSRIDCEIERTQLRLKIRKLRFDYAFFYKKLEKGILDTITALRDFELDEKTQKGIRASKKIFERTLKNRERRLNQYMADLLSKNNKLKTLRFEVGYQRKTNPGCSLVDLLAADKEDISNFLSKIKESKYYPHLKGYIYKHEYCFYTAHRYHFIFLFSEHFTDDEKLTVTDIGELWQLAAGSNNSSYIHCLDQTGYRFAQIGDINENTYFNNDNLSNALRYLKYSDYFFKIKVHKQLHCFELN